MPSKGRSAPLHVTSRRRSPVWLPWLVALPVWLALSVVVVPAAVAGALPMPIRAPAATARLSSSGPAATEYPYRSEAAPALDAYGFVARQCTSFVAWWLNSRGLPFGVITMGRGGLGWFLNASTWDAAARAAGYGVGSRPVVGAIAQWHAGETSRQVGSDGVLHSMTAGETGHVAVVVRVLPDGEVEWLDYGSGGRPELHQGRGVAPRYLYLGVTPPKGP
jgi:surface antigen